MFCRFFNYLRLRSCNRGCIHGILIVISLTVLSPNAIEQSPLLKKRKKNY